MAVRKGDEASLGRRRTPAPVYSQRYATRLPSADLMTPDAGRTLLDEKSRAYFKVSGEEFIELYRCGVYNLNHPKVAKLGALISLLDGE